MRSQPPGERNPLRRNERFADVELDLCVGEERNPAGVAGKETSVEERGDRPTR
jgi:hypothetical protein